MAKTIYSLQQQVFVRLLREARQTAGWTQTELAARLGITQSEVSKMERGERNPDVLQLRVWLQALSVPFTAFVEVLDDQLDELDQLRPFARKRAGSNG